MYNDKDQNSSKRLLEIKVEEAQKKLDGFGVGDVLELKNGISIKNNLNVVPSPSITFYKNEDELFEMSRYDLDELKKWLEK